jgi:RNA polymerase sigma factor (sigma-70 family)
MVWQETPLPPGARLDAEAERELRLISQARAGADWALAALVARYQPMVIRYVTRLVGEPERARELAEKVFLRMERRLHGPHGGEYLRLWLLRASTEAGLDALRHPRRGQAPRLDVPDAPAWLLAERVGASTQRLREGLGKIAERTSATSRQVRQMIWATEPTSEPHQSPWRTDAHDSRDPDVAEAIRIAEEDHLDPRMALRHRIVRAVLAEIPYGDAQCLALHLVAGLNQADVARALGIRASAARHHIVLGLQMFSQRYERALAELGIPRELAYADLNQPVQEAHGRESEAHAEPEPVTIEVTAIPVPDSEPEQDHLTDETGVPATAASSQPVDLPDAASVAAEAAEPISEGQAPIEAEAQLTGAEAREELTSGHMTSVHEEPADVMDAEPAVEVAASELSEDSGSHLGGAGGAHGDEDEGGVPPFLVEPPLWDSPELADGALAPSATLAVSQPSVATLVMDPITPAPEADTSEVTLAAVAGSLAAHDTPELHTAQIQEQPPMGPIIETAGVAASLEPMAQEAQPQDQTVLGYNVVDVPSLPATPVAAPGTEDAAPAVVPVLSPARSAGGEATGEATHTAVVPLLTTGQDPRVVPVLSGLYDEGPSTAPRVVPVRSSKPLGR